MRSPEAFLLWDRLLFVPAVRDPRAWARGYVRLWRCVLAARLPAHRRPPRRVRLQRVEAGPGQEGRQVPGPRQHTGHRHQQEEQVLFQRGKWLNYFFEHCRPQVISSRTFWGWYYNLGSTGINKFEELLNIFIYTYIFSLFFNYSLNQDSETFRSFFYLRNKKVWE